MEEVYCDVPNYEGLYQVSNFGNVKSLPRSWKGGNNSLVKIKERKLKSAPSTDGYYVVSLYKKGVKKTYKVHQLVAICFLNHTPSESCFVVDHIDNDKSNNNETNLQITTIRRNSTKDRVRKDKLPSNVYKNHNKYMVQFVIDGKKKYFGNYTLVSQAQKRADEIRIKYDLY